MTDGTTTCQQVSLSNDAQYIAYSCSNPYTLDVLLQQTCVSSSGTCPPPALQVTSPVPRPDNPYVHQSSFNPIVSDGGRFVAFDSRDATLAGEGLSSQTVFIYDSCIGGPAGCVPRTAPVCLNSQGAIANADCWLGGMSKDGKYISFGSVAGNLLPLPNGVASASYIVKNPLF
jgi:hypothetical protein